MKDYTKFSDEELCVLAKTEIDATTELMKRYIRVVNSQARKYYLNGGETADLILEGMIGLNKAIVSFNGKSSFKTFAYTCIKSSILTLIKQSNRKKNQPLNSSISISGNEDGVEDKTDIIKDTTKNPEQSFIERENEEELLKRVESILSKLEYQIFSLYFIEGYSYTDIENKTSKSAKSIDNTLCRIRKKLNEIRG
ncbi:MAG: sigma-70 family RNA polymerase sigma factor [Clostridia bacterium]|nr:sigma-70 family RNA polymerase sigma factor [Clostridia bacterium]